MEKKQQKNNKSINLTPEQIKTIQISSLVFLCIFIIFLIFKGSPFNIAVLSDSQIENSPNVIKITNTDSENADAVQKEEAETQENSDTLETTELESSKEILKEYGRTNKQFKKRRYGYVCRKFSKQCNRRKLQRFL